MVRVKKDRPLRECIQEHESHPVVFASKPWQEDLASRGALQAITARRKPRGPPETTRRGKIIYITKSRNRVQKALRKQRGSGGAVSEDVWL